MAIKRAIVDPDAFNPRAKLPYGLRREDFTLAMRDIYDFFYDVDRFLQRKGLVRLDDMIRPAALSGLISDMLTASLAKHSRSLVENGYFNGHPDLLLRDKYPGNRAKAGIHGIEIKSTRKRGGAVDTHGARNQWMCVFVYRVGSKDASLKIAPPLLFAEVYLAHVTVRDFRKNPRNELGTRTATLHENGVKKLRANWIYRL